jgi:hypothetical protein
MHLLEPVSKPAFTQFTTRVFRSIRHSAYLLELLGSRLYGRQGSPTIMSGHLDGPGKESCWPIPARGGTDQSNSQGPGPRPGADPRSR